MIDESVAACKEPSENSNSLTGGGDVGAEEHPQWHQHCAVWDDLVGRLSVHRNNEKNKLVEITIVTRSKSII